MFGVFLLHLTGLIARNTAARNGEVRLMAGDTHYEGRVEVFYNGTWGTVCDDAWDLMDARVVCRQLGFGGALAANGSAAFGRGHGKIWMDDIHCAGYENSLPGCRHGGWGRHNCGHSEDAGVKCTPATARFLRGKSPREGLVQVYYNMTWGWVGSDQWDKQDADVACRMMDFDGSISAEFDYEKRTGITTTVWLNNLQCTGNESSLFACVHDGLGCDGCEGKRIAGVVCKSKGALCKGSWQEGSGHFETSCGKNVRLSTRDSIESKGLVEVFHNGIWGTVCAGDWDFKDSNVVCRELGFTGALSLFVSSRFWRGIQPRWLDRVGCVGNETSLMECYHNMRSSYCSRAAGVVCTTARLVGGRSPREGLVQVYHNKTWGWVCAEQWVQKDADVSCRMMDFDGSLSAAFKSKNLTGIDAPVWLSNMQCTGNEKSLFSCVHDPLESNNCRETRNTGVICTPKVRLASWGNVTSQGRVEVFYNGIWGSVCGLQWDLQDARVVCRQLGFKGALTAASDFDRSTVSATRWFSNVRCVGSEISITECYHSGWRDHCHYMLKPWSAAVVCITDSRGELPSRPSEPRTTTAAAAKTAQIDQIQDPP